MSAPVERDSLEFKGQHLRPLERRLSWLIAANGQGKRPNHWLRAEQNALERALHELRDMLDYRAEIDQEGNR